MSGCNSLQAAAYAGSIWIRIVVAAILAATSPFSMAVPFTITPVGPLITHGIQIATDLNDAGLVAGTKDLPNGSAEGFLWDSLSQAYIPLGALPLGITSRGVREVNNSSQLAGNLQGPGTTLPYLWQAGVTSQIPLLPGATSGVVENIGDGGQVVGSNQFPGGVISPHLDVTLPFIYTASGLNQLPLLPGMSHGLALDVNAQGDVVGLQQDLNRQQERAVAWISGVAVDLGFASADALAINNLGVVAASRDSGSPYLTRTFFLWQGGQVSDLFTARGGIFYDMNDSGDAVGSVVLPVVDKFPFRWDPVLGDGFAFLWDPVAGLLNLNDQIDPLSGWSLIEAHAINEHGQIAGRGKNPLGIEQGFLLTRTGEPFIVSRTNQIPEPTTLTLITVGLVGIGCSKRRPKQCFCRRRIEPFTRCLPLLR